MGEELALHLIQHNALEKVMAVLEAVEDFLPHREWTIQKLREEADELDQHNLRGNIAKATGGATSLAAGLTGLALAPVTFGISAIVGSTIAGAGLVTTYGTKAVLMVLSSNTKKAVNNILDADERAFTKLCREWDELTSLCKDIERFNTKWNWNWEDIRECGFWIVEKAIEMLIPIGLSKLGKQGEIITKTLFSIYKNDYFKTNIRDPYLKGEYGLLFHNLSSIIKGLVHNKEFWVDFFRFSGLVFGGSITAFATAIGGGFFVQTSGSLAIIGYSELIDAIENMVKGSVSNVSIAIRQKAYVLEEQKCELEKLVAIVRQTYL